MNNAARVARLPPDWPRTLFGVVAGFVGVALVGVIDWSTGTEISLSILYFLPVGLTVWFSGKRAGVCVSFVAAAVWFSGETRGGIQYSHPAIPYWNASVRFGFFLLATFLLDRVRFFTSNLKLLVTAQTANLVAEVERRKRSEEGLRESEQRFRQFAENIKEVFWMSDVEKDEMIYISPGYEEIWGRTCQSLYASPRDWLEAIHPEDRERVFAAALTKQTLGQYREIYRIVRPDGSLRWIEDRAFPIRDEAGKVCRIVGVADDITERKEMEVTLREAEAKYRSIVEHAQEGIFQSTPEGRFLNVNPALARMLGYSSAEEAIASVTDLGRQHYVHSHVRETIRNRLNEHGSIHGFEAQLRRTDGRIIWVNLNGRLVRDAQGRVLFYEGTNQDITERKRAEQRTAALLTLGGQISAASNSSEAAQIIVNTADALFHWDACYLHLYAPERNEIAPLLTMDTIDGQRVNVPDESFTLDPSPLMLEIMQSGSRLINRATPALTAEDAVTLAPFGDVARKSASMMYVPIRHGPEVVGVLSIQSYTPQSYQREDLETLQTLADHVGGALERIHSAATTQRLEQEILEISKREQRRIGHELHDGLSSFLVGVAMKAKVLEQTLQTENLPHVPEAKDLVDLLNDAVAETRRLARGFAPIEVETNGLVSALQKLSRDTHRSLGVECIFTCSAPTPSFDLTTALHLYRLAQESIHNGIHHGGAQRIEVNLSCADSDLRLTVRDNGKGFDVHASGRSGMGLRIMEYRSRAIGGELSVQSRPNEGTEVGCIVKGWDKRDRAAQQLSQ